MRPARTRARVYAQFLVVMVALGGLGLAASAYILIEQRAPVPFRSAYEVKARFAAANGLTGGLGQPVNVAGVKVGQVSDVRLEDGVALVSMRIDSDQLPHVYANARATLEPITPLQDMQIALNPGSPPAPALAPGATIATARTTTPVPLSQLLDSLDADTRDYLGSLIASLDQGTRGRGADLRRMLLALGPATAQVRRITTALAERRRALTHLVHNLAVVLRAASRDRQLGTVVVTGERTLRALAQERPALRRGLAQLAPTLRLTRVTLADLGPFAAQLRTTLPALTPAVRSLPGTFRRLRPFARTATRALRERVRPLVRAANPVLARLDRIVPRLNSATPHLSRSFEVLEYLANELAYNPPGNDEGFLFWLAWFFHNFNSVVSSGDAHGGIGRAFPLVTCEGLQDMETLQSALGVLGLCPK